MPIGTIKQMFKERGYGFIVPQGGGSDVFLHQKVIPKQYVLYPGAPVEYAAEIDDSTGTLRATSIRLIQ